MKKGIPVLTFVMNNKFCSRSKRSQMKLSFGMIFSIILIVFFLVFAFYAIMKLLEVQDSIKVGKFLDKIQSDVDKMWKGSQGSQEEPYSLPEKIEYVCFGDYSSSSKGENRNFYETLKQAYYSDENLFFYPIGSAGDLGSKKVNHIDLDKMTERDNPFCIKNYGKVKLTIKKGFNENLVTIS
ncbi:MAG: hypothetical protein ABIA78_03795 [archaeon]